MSCCYDWNGIWDHEVDGKIARRQLKTEYFVLIYFTSMRQKYLKYEGRCNFNVSFYIDNARVFARHMWALVWPNKQN